MNSRLAQLQDVSILVDGNYFSALTSADCLIKIQMKTLMMLLSLANKISPVC